MREKRGKIQGKMAKIFIMAWLFLTGVSCFLYLSAGTKGLDVYEDKIVELKAAKLTVGNTSDIGKRLAEIERMERKERLNYQKTMRQYIVLIYVFLTLFLLCLYAYLYFNFLQPFQKLQVFSGEVARGNLDVPLEYSRKNYFGAFTWAFDNMRVEIKRAREAEKAAMDSNKTVISTISHDIRTPVASIRAYCEALQGGFVRSEEKRNEYLALVVRKCDEVKSLTDDLLLHSLSDMERLQIFEKEYAGKELIERIKEGFAVEKRVIWEGEIPDVIIWTDDRRLEQIYGNLIGNALKYAPESDVVVSHFVTREYLEVSIRDFGEGVKEEEIPFLFDRFFRGTNGKKQAGAGLGLYIVHYILQHMEGKIKARNLSDGFEVVFSIKRTVTKNKVTS